jgi:hypothetical protein
MPKGVCSKSVLYRASGFLEGLRLPGVIDRDLYLGGDHLGEVEFLFIDVLSE